MSDISQIARIFAERFERWAITLPRQALERREGGHIFEQGWHIGYQWGERDGEEYVDVLAQHRMTSDSLERLWSSGRVETLEAMSELFLIPRNATPEEAAAAERKYFERNRRVADDLRNRGLLPKSGENLVAHEINEHLRSGGDISRDEPTEEVRRP